MPESHPLLKAPELLARLEFPPSQTKRPVSPGAEKWLGVPVRCLDHGFVYLVDYFGNDLSVEQAARVSYGLGTRKVSETEGLIRYLRRHQHTTPFEMVEMKFHARLPIFVARQWVRHRTASINEYSARYSIVKEEFYLPEPEVLAQQSKGNRQGRGEILLPNEAFQVRRLLTQTAETEYDVYETLLNDDGKGEPVDPRKPMLAREIARAPLGTFFYTEWYWKANLHNVFHFLLLRLDPHAQYEIRAYAAAMAWIVKDAFPIAWQAFEDYELFAQRFSRPELLVLTNLIEKKGIRISVDQLRQAAIAIGVTNKRETNEMVEKFKNVGIVTQS